MMCSVDANSVLWASLPPAVNDPSMEVATQRSVGLSAAAQLSPRCRVVDDAPNVAGTTSPVISLDATGKGTRSGRLEARGDRDAFRVNIAAAGTYQFDQVGVSLSDSYLRLLDSSRRELVSADNGAGGLNSRITRTMTTGTYYLVAGSKGTA